MVSEVHLVVLFLLCHCHLRYTLAQNIVCYMRIHAMLALERDFNIHSLKLECSGVKRKELV